MNKEEMQNLAAKIDTWASSPAGKEALDKTAARVREIVENAERLRRIDHQLLNTIIDL